MGASLPGWALRAVTPDDHGVALAAHRRGSLRVTWPDLTSVRGWARQQGWPVPWFGFERAFIAALFASPENFARAVATSGIVLQLPRQGYALPTEQLAAFDALYAAGSSHGQAAGWGRLVEELRGVRRAVEAGVAVQIAGARSLTTWQEFYGWAHGRYPLLEEGSDHWIGDDDS